MNQKQLETRKQDGSLSVTSRKTIRVLKERETAEKKEERGVKKSKSNINTVIKEHFLPENT